MREDVGIKINVCLTELRCGSGLRPVEIKRQDLKGKASILSKSSIRPNDNFTLTISDEKKKKQISISELT